jgi:hypothetical protein
MWNALDSSADLVARMVVSVLHQVQLVELHELQVDLVLSPMRWALLQALATLRTRFRTTNSIHNCQTTAAEYTGDL